MLSSDNPKRSTYLLLTIGLFVVEVLIATVFADFHFVRAYLGDFLVVILLYTLVKVFYNAPPLALLVAIFLLACGVEVAQYFRLAEVLGLPPGGLLSILLGTSFSWLDIVMYGGGCLTAYVFESYEVFFKPRSAT